MNELLYQVPEFYSLYNYRRQVIEQIFQALQGEDAAEKKVSLLQSELRLNTSILKRDFKVYGAFSYRHWVVDQWMKVAEEDATALAALLTALEKEKENCRLLLELDARNFHSWNYRRWALLQLEKANEIRVKCNKESETAPPLTGFFLPDEEAELSFTVEKIQSNFSNYSAWHQRGYIVRKALARRGSSTQTDKEEVIPSLWRVISDDFKYLLQSIFCDPNDQASWCYAGFCFELFRQFEEGFLSYYTSQPSLHTDDDESTALLHQCHGDIRDAFVQATVNLIREQKALQEDKECFLPYYFLLNEILQLRQTVQAGDSKDGQRLQRYVALLPEVLEGAEGLDGVIASLQSHLVTVDPYRREMYRNLYQQTP
ncbi:geranylgeranyl transferase type-2 subunit alpha [Angomonas deanei]|nr:geranylgeranyl transferase type-2 subunit alpha [Angomonas deanei]|eukprot:EPY35450.1 geranylgeranyl transferase type-2 subunit alpha [Angomonas deanei]